MGGWPDKNARLTFHNFQHKRQLGLAESFQQLCEKFL